MPVRRNAPLTTAAKTTAMSPAKIIRAVKRTTMHKVMGTSTVDSGSIRAHVATMLTPEAARCASLTLCRWALTIVIERRNSGGQR